MTPEIDINEKLKRNTIKTFKSKLFITLFSEENFLNLYAASEINLKLIKT